MHIYTIFVVLCYSQWPSVSECLRCVVHFLGLDFHGRPSLSRQTPWRPSGDSVQPRGSGSGTGSVAAQTGGHAGNPPRIEAKSRWNPENQQGLCKVNIIGPPYESPHQQGLGMRSGGRCPTRPLGGGTLWPVGGVGGFLRRNFGWQVARERWGPGRSGVDGLRYQLIFGDILYYTWLIIL